MSTPSRPRTREALVDHVLRQAERLLHAERVVRRVDRAVQAGLLGQEAVHPVAGDHDAGRVRSPSGRSVATPTTRPRSSRSSPVAVVEHTSCAPSASALPASQWSQSGRYAVAPLYGGRPHVAGAEVDRQRLVVGEDHRGATGDPPLHRRLVPPLGVELVEDARVDDAAVHVLRAGERPALEEHHRVPGAGEHGGGARPGRSGADHDDVDVDAHDVRA